MPIVLFGTRPSFVSNAFSSFIETIWSVILVADADRALTHKQKYVTMKSVDFKITFFILFKNIYIRFH